MNINIKRKFHFIGVAGAGMSAIAQYLAADGHVISGSDREIDRGNNPEITSMLQEANILIVPQDGHYIDPSIDAVVISTAIEGGIPDLEKAKAYNITVKHRADILRLICDTKRTIAIAGTSGKSTTTAMAFHILHELGLGASVITGAGLVTLQKSNKIGNAFRGHGEWLIVEADESDGSLVKYHPEIGVLLNVDKDHKDMNELKDIFDQFKTHSINFIVNRSHPLAKTYSKCMDNDFGINENCGYSCSDFLQTTTRITFKINDIPFDVPVLGIHNMENCAAAVAAVCKTGLATIYQCSSMLHSFEGIYRRNQILGIKNGALIVDDYAHNPSKIVAAIRTFQTPTNKVIAWFQPHGYGPTRLLKDDFVKEIAYVLRENDICIMSEIYYAGGTAIKDISANDLVEGIKSYHKNALFIEDRNNLKTYVAPLLNDNTVLLLMGARDPSLEKFTKDLYESL